MATYEHDGKLNFKLRLLEKSNDVDDGKVVTLGEYFSSKGICVSFIEVVKTLFVQFSLDEFSGCTLCTQCEACVELCIKVFITTRGL